MLKLAILGLLQKEPLNGYRLKQQLEMFMGGCICANYGAIYPQLKRMEEQGDVVLLTEETRSADQSGKVYQITSSGRDRWRQEMLAHPQESWVNARSRLLIKFFFFSHLLPEERVQLLEHRLMNCRLRLTSKQSEETSTDFYQATMQKRSIDVVISEIEWLTEQLDREKTSS